MEQQQMEEIAERKVTKKLVAKVQKSGEPWTDESGITIPFNRINSSEKIRERYAGAILTEAIKLSNLMLKLHEYIKKAEQEVNNAILKEGKKTSVKGSFTWYNFDRSIRIEVNNNDTLAFDEGMIAAAREKLDLFLSDSVTATEDIVRQLITSAFHNNKGGIDSKQVLRICKFRSKIKDERFIAAIDLIEASQSVSKSKKYYRVWAKNEDGQYQNINLNFANL